MINDMKFRRREMLKVGAAGAGILALGRVAGATIPELAQRLSLSAITTAEAGSVYIEAFPTSPLILDPFTQALKLGEGIPDLQRPVPYSEYSRWASPPQKDAQDSNGGQHHYW